MENRLQTQAKKGNEINEKKEDYNYFDEGSEEIILDDPAPVNSLNKGEKKQVEIDPTKINFNSFEVLTVLGSGAFGKVYKVNISLLDEITCFKGCKERHEQNLCNEGFKETQLDRKKPT